MTSLSQNTQAILLLTAPLIAGRGGSSADLLFFEQSNGDMDDDLVRKNLARLLGPVVTVARSP
jgi:hypothetical protein